MRTARIATVRALTVLVAGQLFAADANSAAMFQGLGFRVDGSASSDAFGVSPDGQTVVGRTAGPMGTEASTWSADEGWTGIGDVSTGSFSSEARSASADGSVAVGYGTIDGNPGNFRRAFRADALGITPLVDLPGGGIESEAWDINHNGNAIVGQSGSAGGRQATVWSADAPTGLGWLPGGADSVARGISADGSVIVGGSGSSFGTEAFHWTAADGMVGLGDFPGGAFFSTAYDVSADGSTIVGYGTSASGLEAFLWNAEVGLLRLGDLPGLDYASVALAVSMDGSTVVGRGVSDAGQEAFLWTPEDGLRNLSEVLQVDLGLDLGGWKLVEAWGISDDGTTIVGRGVNPAGEPEGWVAIIPEPSTASLLAIGLAGIAVRRRASRAC